jgi:hypothetical protein
MPQNQDFGFELASGLEAVAQHANVADRIRGFIHFALSLISFYFGFIRK